MCHPAAEAHFVWTCLYPTHCSPPNELHLWISLFFFFGSTIIFSNNYINSPIVRSVRIILILISNKSPSVTTFSFKMLFTLPTLFLYASLSFLIQSINISDIEGTIVGPGDRAVNKTDQVTPSWLHLPYLGVSLFQLAGSLLHAASWHRGSAPWMTSLVLLCRSEGSVRWNPPPGVPVSYSLWRTILNSSPPWDFRSGQNGLSVGSFPFHYSCLLLFQL